MLQPIKKEVNKHTYGIVWEEQPEDKADEMMDKFPSLERCEGIHNEDDSYID